MKLDQLRYFIETAKLEHIGKASKVLNISPSAISHSIANLEDELGRELFIKQGKRIFLTSHGKLLAERGVHLLAEAERISEEVKSDQVELQGHYRLGATHLLCEEILVPIWNEVQGNHPNITGEIYTHRSADVLAKVCAGELDLGICLSPQSSPLFESEVLWAGQLLPVVRKKHPILKKVGVERIRSLANYKSCLPKSFQGIENCETHPSIKLHKMNSEVGVMYDSYSVAIRTILNSDSWTLLPDILVERNKKSFESIAPRGWEAPYTLDAIWPKDRIMTKLLRMVVDRLKAQF